MYGIGVKIPPGVVSFCIQGAKLLITPNEAYDINRCFCSCRTCRSITVAVSFLFIFSDCYTWMIVQPTYTLQGLHTAPSLLPDSQKHGQLPNADRFYTVMSNGAWQGTEVNNTSWMHSKPFWRRLYQPCPSGDFLSICQTIDLVLRDIR